MRDLPAQPEPVDTGGLSVHQIVVYDAAVETTERATGRRIFEGAVRPGDALVVRPETVANATFTTWTEGLGFTGIMLPVPTVAAAARALDRDYAALDFRERFAHRDPFLSAAARQLGHELESGTPGAVFTQRSCCRPSPSTSSVTTRPTPPSRALPEAESRRVSSAT
ncbi:MAG: hypothetical protein AAF845_10235 [Bacteroidota bacterium]